MRERRLRLAALALTALLSAFAFGPARANGPGATLEDDPKFRGLHAMNAGEAALAKSEAELTVPRHGRAFVGPDDAAYDAFLSGQAAPDDCSCRREEAAIRLTRRGTIAYRFYDSTFVDLDYERLNFAEVLSSVRKAERQAADAGVDVPYRVFAWARRPRYDPATHATTWMFHARRPDGRPLDVAQAIVLSRFGYETLYAEAEKNADTWSVLHTGLAAIRFPVGLRYEDTMPDERDARTPLGFVIPEVAGAQIDGTLAVWGRLPRRDPWGNPFVQAGFLIDVAIGAVVLIAIVGFVMTRGRRRRIRRYRAERGIEQQPWIRL